MKVYVTARFKGADNKREIDALCKAVKNARLQDFCFVRDVEHYKHTFDNPKQLWDRTRDEIMACDMLLVDVSDNPTGGRVVEAGMAYAMRKPVIIVKKQGIKHKPVFDGISATVITYKDMDDLSSQLKQFDIDRNYNVTDKMTLLVMFLLVGGVIGWGVGQLFLPLGMIAAVAYWLIVRHFAPFVRMYDRIVIYVPLVFVWWLVFATLNESDVLLAMAWTAAFWLLAVLTLRKLKLSL